MPPYSDDRVDKGFVTGSYTRPEDNPLLVPSDQPRYTLNKNERGVDRPGVERPTNRPSATEAFGNAYQSMKEEVVGFIQEDTQSSELANSETLKDPSGDPVEGAMVGADEVGLDEQQRRQASSPQSATPQNTGQERRPVQGTPPAEENLIENRNTFMDQNPPTNQRGGQQRSQSRQGQTRQIQQSGDMPAWQREMNQMLANAQESVNQQNGSGSGRSQSRGGRGRGGRQVTERRTAVELQESVNPGPRSDFVEDASDDVVMMDPGASQEEIQEVMSQGKRPVLQPELSNVEEFQEIDVDFSRSKEAVRNFADAKVQAAKKGALASQVGAENANTRLMANALGPGLFQALSGVQQPTNQQSNFNAQAARRVEEAEKAKKQAEQTAELAPAQAEQQVAQIDQKERQRQQNLDRETRRLNNSQKRRKAQMQLQAQKNYVNSVIGMAEEERQRQRSMLWEQEKKLMEQDPSFNSQQISNVKDLNDDIARKQRRIREMRSAVAALRNNSDVSDERQREIVRQIAKKYGVGDGGFLSMDNSKQVTQLQSAIDEERSDLESRKNKRNSIINSADRGAFGGVDPFEIGGNPETPGEPEGQVMDGGQSENKEEDDNSRVEPDNAAEEEFLQRNGVDL